MHERSVCMQETYTYNKFLARDGHPSRVERTCHSHTTLYGVALQKRGKGSAM